VRVLGLSPQKPDMHIQSAMDKRCTFRLMWSLLPHPTPPKYSLNLFKSHDHHGRRRVGTCPSVPTRCYATAEISRLRHNTRTIYYKPCHSILTGTLKMRDWKMRDWQYRHHMTGGGKCRTGKFGNSKRMERHVWHNLVFVPVCTDIST